MKGGENIAGQFKQGFFSRLFGGLTGSKPKAVAFVDFEHWYISLDRFYHTRPDMKAWLAELSKTYDVREIFVFADFSNQSIRAEIPKIREVTNYIIETQNASAYITKDFTDFIMLDHIYQKAMSGTDLSAFIIFSGDGHFSSVASFLRNQCKKTMVVYGVRRAMSSQLRNTASICVEIPNDEQTDDPRQPYFDMIFGNLRFLEDNNRGSQKLYPTFWGTVDAVAAYYNSNRDDVTDAMRYLLERDYIYQTDETVEPRKTIKVIRVNWELAEREGVFRRSAQKTPVKETAAQNAPPQPRQRRDNGHPQRQPQRYGDLTDKPVTAAPERATVKPNQNDTDTSRKSDDRRNQRPQQPKPEASNNVGAAPVTNDNAVPEASKTAEQVKKPNQPRQQKPIQNAQKSDKKPETQPSHAEPEAAGEKITEAEPVKREQKQNQPRSRRRNNQKSNGVKPSADETAEAIDAEAVSLDKTDDDKAAKLPVEEVKASFDVKADADNNDAEKNTPRRLSAEEVLKRAIEEEKSVDMTELDTVMAERDTDDDADDDKYSAIAEAAGIEADAPANKPKRRRRGRRGSKKPAHTDGVAFAPEAPD